jgi:hypothetical protein
MATEVALRSVVLDSAELERRATFLHLGADPELMDRAARPDGAKARRQRLDSARYLNPLPRPQAPIAEAWLVHLLDPDGNRVELIQRPDWPIGDKSGDGTPITAIPSSWRGSS